MTMTNNMKEVPANTPRDAFRNCVFFPATRPRYVTNRPFEPAWLQTDTGLCTYFQRSVPATYMHYVGVQGHTPFSHSD